MKKRIIFLLFSLIMLSSLTAISASAEDPFAYAESYETIYEALKEQFASGRNFIYEEPAAGGAFYESAVLLDSGAAAETGSITAETDFSETNLLEKGIDEADIIKTDGDYIYILRQDGSFAIVRADGAASEAVSITALPDLNECRVHELYLKDDMLNIVATQTVTSLSSNSDVYYTATTRQSVLYTYDITDRSAPALTGTIYQEGYYSDSRRVGNHIYLFTTYTPSIADTYEESRIIPYLNGRPAAASDFYLPQQLLDSTYLVISSIDTNSPDEITDSKVLVSGASCFYVSTEHIYIANQIWNNSEERTELVKFRYQDGQISGVAAASVPGYLNNSFSLNEYEGNLRAVSTYYGTLAVTQDGSASPDGLSYMDTSANDWTEHNGLFLFDSDMRQIGQILDLAPGETIRSARFFGDTGYFVTFRQTDPLFSVDLSDPANPQILGELKISGFSSYLHFYGENLLLGLGYEADEETGFTTGLKLSMFDISDPSNVTEQGRFVIPGLTWCPAIENYKSLLIDPEKNLIGFFCDNRYLVFSWQNGFSQELVYDFYSDQLMGAADYDTMRGLFIGDELYLAGESFVVTFDMKNGYAKTGLLRIGTN